MDHRQTLRCRALTLVDIHGRRGCSAGLVYDVSHNGMFVLSEAIPEINDRVDIHMALSSDGGSPVRVPGRVVHRGKNGFGVRFRELGSSARGTVKKFLAVCRA